MRLLIFSYYYYPDLSAGAFRTKNLVKSLEKKLSKNDELHVITTTPNRYSNFKVRLDISETADNLKIHRIPVPNYKTTIINQIFFYSIFAAKGLVKCLKINPDFIYGTSSRLMTAILTWISAKLLHKAYFIDLRDIFSETMSDLVKSKNILLGNCIKSIFFFFEKRVLTNASGVNLVSEGFFKYFSDLGIDTSTWTFYPNGIDDDFLENDYSENKVTKNKKKIILYAGNIGQGQGLEKIVPQLAERLGTNYTFIIIGDGGMRSVLEHKIKSQELENVVIKEPCLRSELIKNYQSADILFLHLNDIPAFKRVLPSKIFEYVVMNKPIIAGVDGYASKFLDQNVDHSFVFPPCNVEKAIECFKEIDNKEIEFQNIEIFIQKYSRKKIMNSMTDKLLTLAKSKIINQNR